MTKLTGTLTSAALTLALALTLSAADAAQGRAVSLRMLEKVLKEGTLKAAHTLCGITRVSGFVVDAKSKDIVLVGKVDPSCPALHADDFIVALRAANMLYARREGNTRYYTAPGCSIDPDPKTIRQLQQAQSRHDDSESGYQALIREWEAIGRQPQQVRVLGVPYDTRFASVMVDADYYMKRLSNGSVDLGIPGFTSVMAMNVEETKKEFRSGITSQPSNSLNRFWFCPGESTYEENDGFVMLKECKVRLLTEEEFLTAAGQVKGKGKPSACASRFASGFSTHYQAIAEARPIYRELESLFRFSAIANLLRDTKASSRSGNSLSYLLSGYKVRKVSVSRTLPGITRVVELNDEQEVGGGKVIRYSVLMTCGGVEMDVRPRKVSSAPAVRKGSGGAGASGGKKPSSPSLGKTVLSGRKSPGAIYWDFPLPD